MSNIYEDSLSREEKLNLEKNRIISFFEEILEDEGELGKLREDIKNLKTSIEDKFESFSKELNIKKIILKTVYNEFKKLRSQIEKKDKKADFFIYKKLLEIVIEENIF